MNFFNIRTIIRSLYIALILLSFSTIFLSGHFFIFDLFSHFQLQYFCGLVIFSLFFLLRKDWMDLVVNLVYGIFLFSAFIYPVHFFVKDNIETDLFYINAQFNNKDTHEITAEIKNKNPQIVALVEINNELKNQLEAEYGKPKIYHDSGDSFSCAIFSKNKVLNTEAILDYSYPICRADFPEFTLLVVRPHPPFNPYRLKLQIKYFAAVKSLIENIEKEGRDFLVVGDFNSTYYSANYRRFFDKYFRGNFYSWNIVSILALPIDHALSNLSIQISRGSRLSSDHVPLLIDIR